MALITRISRLLRADLHAVLDRLEAPELVLAQAIREMEQALDLERRRLRRLDRELQRLRERESEQERLLEQSGLALDDCLAAEREDLARPVIRRRLETERRFEALRTRRRETETERARCAPLLAERESRLADLRARAAIQDAESEPDPTDFDPIWTGADPLIRDAEVEVALLQAKRRREAQS
jgi:phage shock protein A